MSSTNSRTDSVMNRSTNRVPKINTTEMHDILKELMSMFASTERIAPLWICGRSDNFGFRPHSDVNFLEKLTRLWISKLAEGIVVVVPIVFYTCSENALELSEDSKGEEGFLVDNHYNILISTKDMTGTLQIERYEPSLTSLQGNLDELMKTLITGQIKKYTNRPVNYKLVSPRGLQSIYKDNRLCGHHILYWILYRLKYGSKEVVNMLSDPATVLRFEQFYRCVGKYNNRKRCVEVV